MFVGIGIRDTTGNARLVGLAAPPFLLSDFLTFRLDTLFGGFISAVAFTDPTPHDLETASVELPPVHASSRD